MTELRIGDELALPLELATQSIGVYGVKGSGKTFAAKVLAEELVAAGVQVVAIDPTDAWWGLRSSADGQSAGLPVYVFGGEYGDVPLEGAGGELLADVVVDHGISAVLSLRHLRKADQHRFVTAFAEQLYHRKGEAAHRTPLHLFIDEAHSFAPQQVRGDTARMVGALEDLVRLGRSSGIGCTMISQRPASVNNNIRTQCETLVCLRILAPHDRKALEAWIEAHDSEGKGREFLASLAALRTGEAWVWSPPLDLFERATVRRLRTFDSSATPKPGEQRVEPQRLASVDLDALRERMASTIEAAQANDPRQLRARVAELERQLDSSEHNHGLDHSLADQWQARNEELLAQVERLESANRTLAVATAEAQRWRDVARRIGAQAAAIAEEIEIALSGPVPEEYLEAARGLEVRREAREAAGGARRASPPPRPVEARAVVPATGRGVSDHATPASTVTPYMRDLLVAAAATHPARSTRAQLSLLSGRSHRSSAFGPALRSVVDHGYLDEAGDGFLLTDRGLDEVGDARPPTGAEAASWWRNRLSGGELAFFDALLASSRALSREELAAATGRSLTSSAFGPALRDLVDRGLIERNGDRYRVVDSLVGVRV